MFRNSVQSLGTFKVMTTCVCFLLVFQSLLGLSYSLLACALWPMVAFVVPEHQLGTAYGLYVPISRTHLQLKRTLFNIAVSLH